MNVYIVKVGWNKNSEYGGQLVAIAQSRDTLKILLQDTYNFDWQDYGMQLDKFNECVNSAIELTPAQILGHPTNVIAEFTT